MSDLVTFHCPAHGPVLDTVPSAVVHHRVESHNGKPACGRACSPEGGRKRRSRALTGLEAAIRGRRRAA